MEDIIGIKGEVIDGTTALLETVMQDGRMIGRRPALLEIRQSFLSQFAKLADRYKRLSKPDPYPVRLSPALEALQKTVGDTL